MKNTFVIGISYKNANVDIRSAFSINPEKQLECYNLAKTYDFKDFVVLSTCNRTEVYGAGPIHLAEHVISTVTGQPKEFLDQYKFVKTTDDAVAHIFNVASGLDSQILGDYEILGQFKNACKLSKENGMLSPVFERMANICIQASKEVKTKTDISKGTVSASYAAIEILKEKYGDNKASCLLIGLGKFGNNILKNIKHYLPNIELTISNRTLATAVEAGDKHNLNVIRFEDAAASIKDFDAVIISAITDKYIITPEVLENAKTSLVLDLSIPKTVAPECSAIEGVEIYDINSISAILDRSFEHRKTFLPIANDIINQHIAAFIDWNSFYYERNKIVALKEMLMEASLSCTHLARLDQETRDRMVKKAIQAFVLSLKQKDVIDLKPEQIVDNFMRYATAN